MARISNVKILKSENIVGDRKRILVEFETAGEVTAEFLEKFFHEVYAFKEPVVHKMDPKAEVKRFEEPEPKKA
jgi:hypothetical protein